ncbi:MAG: helix-turn-helix transcriptional regulator [Christensenellaceae bacterium]|nr:helix-turn-helix transcriptional regulator [Christensenellaceae bacterium]
MKHGQEVLTVNQAVAKRIRELLKLKCITQYRLEINSDIQHSQMDFILKDRNKTVTFTTIIKLANGFGISLKEFIDCNEFEYDKLDVGQ